MNNLIFSIAQIFPFKFLYTLNKQKTIFPLYHSVSDISPIHLKHLYKIKSTKEFVEDLDFYLKNFKRIDLKLFINEKFINEKTFFLTFDDGLSEIYDIVAPLLKKKGIPAIFFINSAFVDNLDLFYRYKISLIIDKTFKNTKYQNIVEKYLKKININTSDIKKYLLSLNHKNTNVIEQIAKLLEIDFAEYLQKHKPYMSSNQIKELHNQGFYIGAHSANHFYYSQLTENEQIQQTIDSLDFVIREFNPEFKLFAFPFTDYKVNKSFFERISTSVDLTFGTAGLKNDSIKFNIQRIPMENGKTAIETIKYEFFYYLIKGIFGKNLIKR